MGTDSRREEPGLKCFEEEYVGPQHAAPPDTPERRLLRGVLTLAFRDLGKKRWRADAERWFASNDERPNSFVWLCHMLNLEPDYIRRLVKEGRITQQRIVGPRIVRSRVGGEMEKHDRGKGETLWSSLRGRRAHGNARTVS